MGRLVSAVLGSDFSTLCAQASRDGLKLKQPIIALYFESENDLKFYNLEAWSSVVCSSSLNWCSGVRLFGGHSVTGSSGFRLFGALWWPFCSVEQFW